MVDAKKKENTKKKQKGTKKRETQKGNRKKRKNDRARTERKGKALHGRTNKQPEKDLDLYWNTNKQTLFGL